MEGVIARLPPLPFLGIPQSGELAQGFLFEYSADDASCSRGVPDRPAESCLNSFIAAIHREDDGQAGGQPAGEPGVHCLDGQAAMVRDGRLSVSIHVANSISAFDFTSRARTSTLLLTADLASVEVVLTSELL
jgi:hypothetical protein